ncbi:hypothetical protein BXZ70DRAFT_452982 [Cristinia sonorae]|uniref:F-box domain-containing protein n=1 Tax=Cristinia sonorae TaxID=1940300 RepID=A0A8K0UHS6_9AGAR|nr:hypothetical protein BXZ70DRAFT_452982 [Cristinia sonorae]
MSSTSNHHIQVLVDGLLAQLHQVDLALPRSDGISTFRSELSRLRTSLVDAISVIDEIHNAVSPVNQLPVELLVHIFRMIQDEILVHLPTTSSRWIGLLHVCHHWRHVLLSEPIFWSRVLIDNSVDARKMVEFCTSRAGSLPIRIIRNTDGPPYDIWTTLTPQHLSRMRALHYIFTTRSLFEPITVPAHSLEYLRICCHDGEGKIGVLFQNQTKSLRCLCLQNIVSWAGNHFSHLTTLFLKGIKNQTRGIEVNPLTSTYRLLLQLLQDSPTLQQFIIIFPSTWVPNEMQQPGDELPRVKLPNLRQMCISRTETSRVRCFLSQLELPRHLCISIPYSRTGHDTPTYAPFPEDVTKLPFLDSIASLEFCFSRSGRVQVIGTGSSGSFNANIALNLFENTAGEERVVLETYIHQLGIHRNLTEVWIQGTDETFFDEGFGLYSGLWDACGEPVLRGSDMWCRILSEMGVLEKLVLDGTWMTHYLCSLAPSFDCEPGPLQQTLDLPVVPCPRLKHLWVADKTDTLFAVAERLLYFASGRHSFLGIPFHEILLRSNSHDAAFCELASTAPSHEMARLKALDALRGLKKHVETFNFVDAFPTGIFELPALTTASNINETGWPKWRNPKAEGRKE